ncbi:MAG: ribosome small subunit-dependent GTPase A [Thiobacillaceae bacterium]|nr:ribosome small subunit-dependent GTPase A [Thiobacillaceae bacterium]
MLRGRVVAVHGRRYQVEAEGRLLSCVTRGKRGGVACNDRVELTVTGPEEGVIERILPRDNLLWRSDGQREKLLAANVDLAVVVTAAVPTPREGLLDRCLVAAEAAGVRAVILVNKVDLAQSAAYVERLRPYEALGYPVLALSAKLDVTPLRPWLAGRVSVLVGASGVGKSTLINALVPQARAATAEHSQALDAGRHTTTHTRLYPLPQGGALIDAPGMQEFGLRHLRLSELQAAFPELRGLAGRCRFNDCRHLREPGCAVRAAMEEGRILPARWRVYRDLLRENGHSIH